MKTIAVDSEVSPALKKWALRIGIPLGCVLGGGAIAWAGGLHLWGTGDSLQAADLNGNFAALQAQITTLQTEITGITQSSAVAVEAAAPVNNVPYETFTNLPFATVDWDVLGEWSAVDGFTPKNAGVYELCASVYWGTAVSGEVDAFVNGKRLRAMGYSISAGVTQGCVDVKLSAGDNAQVYVYQSSAPMPPLPSVQVNTLWTYMNVHRVY